MSSVRGRTRTSFSSGGGSVPVVVAISLRSSWSIDFDACFRVADDRARGCRKGTTAASSSGGTNRAAEATARSGPTVVAREVSSSARSMEIWRGVADATPEPSPVMAG